MLNFNTLKQDKSVTELTPFRQDGKSIMETHGRIHFGHRNVITVQNDFLQAYVYTKGLAHKACEMAHIRYTTYKGWITNNKWEFLKRFEEAKEKVNEAVEASLIRKMDTNSPNAEMFYLKSRNPRYKQVAVLEGSDEKPIVIKHDEKTLEKVAKKIMESLKAE